MANKIIGRLYIKINGQIYKVATIKAGNDGSIYIGAPLGPGYKGRGLSGNKFTYHPDGKSWITGELRFKDLGVYVPDDVLRRLLIEPKSSGFRGVVNGKLYSKHFGEGIPLADIKDVVKLQYGISYNDILRIDHQRAFESATPSQKIDSAKIIEASRYKHLTLRFFLLGEHALKMGVKSYGAVEEFYFKHPTIDDLCIAVLAVDEWAGDKKI